MTDILFRHKTNKEMSDINNIINQMILTNMYRTSHPEVQKGTRYSHVHTAHTPE